MGLLAWVWCVGLFLVQHVAAAEPEGLSVAVTQIGWQGHSKVGEWTRLRCQIHNSQDKPISFVLSVAAPDADDQTLLYRSPPATLQPRSTHETEAVFRMGRLEGTVRLQLHDTSGVLVGETVLRSGQGSDVSLRPGLRVHEPLWVTLGPIRGFSRAIPQDLSGMPFPRVKPGSRNSRSTRRDSAVDATSRGDATGTGRSEGTRDVAESSPRGDGLNSGKGDASTITGTGPALAVLEDTAELPHDPRAFHSVDVLVFDAEGWPTVTVEQSAVLRDWVGQGGHLCLSLGSDVEAFAKSALREWLPFSVNGLTEFRQLSSLEGYAGVKDPLRVNQPVSVAALVVPEGVVLAGGSGGALVARVPYGLGFVTVLAPDLNQRPLSTWPGLPALCAKLVREVRPDGASRMVKSSAQLAQIGLNDLSSQLHAVLDNFPTVNRWSYWSVIGLTILFALCVGVVDYVLVHRVLNRPVWTWVSLPLWTAAVLAATWWASHQLNGARVVVNQLDLVDLDTSTQRARVSSWFTTYTPETCRSQIDVKPSSDLGRSLSGSRDVSPAWLGWSAAPENHLGGMYRQTGVGVGGRSYETQVSAMQLEHVPQQQWSSRSFVAHWDAVDVPLVTSDLESAGLGRINGSLTHRLPVPVEEFYLVYGGRAYLPGNSDAKLHPHRPWQPGRSDVRQRELKGFLTGTVAFRQQRDRDRVDLLYKTQPYNPLNLDRADLVRMLSFHQAAGGREYTGLQHAALRELELTPHLQTQRAVLIGRLSRPLTVMHLDQQPAPPGQQDTYIRMIIPVKPAPRPER